LIVAALAVAAAIGGACAGCHPTGTPIIDPLESAAFAAAFTLIMARAARGFWLVFGVVVVLLARGWLLVPAALTIGGAFATAFAPRSRRRFGAAVGALGVQVVLRWPAQVFHGFPTLAAAVLFGFVGVSAWRRSSARIRRLALRIVGGLGVAAIIVSLPAVIEALTVRQEVTVAETSARAALSAVGSGSSQAVSAELRQASLESSDAAGALGGWFTLGARLVPVVAQQDRLLADATRSAAQTAGVGARYAPSIDYHRLGYHDGKVNLDRLTAMERPMADLKRALETTDQVLRAVDSPWLIAPLQDRVAPFRADVRSALHGATLAVQAARVLPPMLGGAGTRTYFVAFMTPSESRGYDGLIGSYGLLTATDGRVRLTVSGSIDDIQEALPKGGATLEGLPSFLARYGGFHPGEFPQDATYPPDLPTVAQVLNEIYEQSAGGSIDGVLALDPVGLAALLHFTGPVEVSGLPVPLTQQNAAKVLLTEQYTTFDVGTTNQDIIRHDFLQGALRAAFDKLVAGSLPAPKDIASVLGPAVQDGRISFWSFHKDEQPFLDSLGIDGSFPTAHGGDLLALTTQNSGNNKIDAYLHTSMNDHVSFDPGTGHVQSLVRIRLTNTAPSSGLPPIVIDSPADPGLAPGTNRTWLTLYSPLDLTKVTIGGAQAAVRTDRELGVNAYSLYVNVPAESEVSVSVSLEGKVHAGSTLSVVVRKQPSANAEAVSVEVSPVGPWGFKSRNDGTIRWDLSGAMRQRRTYIFSSR
jgi:hypothetical protein